jgi:hypothetical protein
MIQNYNLIIVKSLLSIYKQNKRYLNQRDKKGIE